jgi:DNA-binding PadR family transcriptional regulator
VNDWVQAEWGVSESNRKARIYKLTAAGRKRLAEERRSFGAMILAIGRGVAGGAAVLAALGPSSRAARINPNTVLRAD